MPGKRSRLHVVAIAALASMLLLGAPAAAQDAATPVAGGGASAIAPRPAHIHTGSCGALGEVVFPLVDVPTVAVQAIPSLTAVGQSITTVDVALADILAGEHAVNVHASAEAIEDYIACGEITGTVTAGQLAIPLGELNDSGFTGEAVLVDGGDGTTTVSVVLVGTGDTGSQPSAPAGATPAAGEIAAGTVIATTSENVRVRAEPTTEGEILAILETGTEMEVTGTPEEADDFLWYPVSLVVDDEELTGWLAADFVAPVEDGG
jgi:hypothetical protein